MNDDKTDFEKNLEDVCAILGVPARVFEGTAEPDSLAVLYQEWDRARLDRLRAMHARNVAKWAKVLFSLSETPTVEWQDGGGLPRNFKIFGLTNFPDRITCDEPTVVVAKGEQT